MKSSIESLGRSTFFFFGVECQEIDFVVSPIIDRKLSDPGDAPYGKFFFVCFFLC